MWFLLDLSFWVLSSLGRFREAKGSVSGVAFTVVLGGLVEVRHRWKSKDYVHLKLSCLRPLIVVSSYRYYVLARSVEESFLWWEKIHLPDCSGFVLVIWFVVVVSSGSDMWLSVLRITSVLASKDLKLLRFQLFPHSLYARLVGYRWMIMVYA